MSSTRRSFIAAAGAAGVAIITPPASAAEPPKPTPSATPSPPPSPASQSIAHAMRRFDPSLSDEQIATIARGIDEQNRAGTLIRKRQVLRNGDEPAPEFSVTR